MSTKAFSHLDLDTCAAAKSTSKVWIVFADGRDNVTSLPPSPRIDQQVYLYNTAAATITESYRIGGRTVTNAIGKIEKTEKTLIMNKSASLQKRRNNFQGAVLKIVVEHCGPFLKLKNPHELSEEDLIRQLSMTAFSCSSFKL
jgi:hypothetical protein